MTDKKSVTTKKTIIEVEHRNVGGNEAHHAHHVTTHTASHASEKKPKVVSKKIEVSLAENIIELQKINTNLAEKFEKLADQISRLLGLFEMTAKTFADNPALKTSEKDREFLDKIDKLLEQNKTIAKGLTMMEERVRDKVAEQQNMERPSIMGQVEEFRPDMGNKRPLPRF